jgi:hypothetical protein
MDPVRFLILAFITHLKKCNPHVAKRVCKIQLMDFVNAVGHLFSSLVFMACWLVILSFTTYASGNEALQFLLLTARFASDCGLPYSIWIGNCLLTNQIE